MSTIFYNWKHPVQNAPWKLHTVFIPTCRLNPPAEQRLLSRETTTSRRGMKILHGFQLKSNCSHQHPPEELALPPRQPGHASDSWASSPGGGVWAPSDSTTKKKKKKGSFYLCFHSQVLAARTGKLLVKCLER